MPVWKSIGACGYVTNWSSISNLADEVKLTIVKTNAAGFTKGDMYFGTGDNGIIGKLTADGTTIRS